MRTVFFLLLAANLGFLAWSYFGGRGSTEAQLMEQQLNPQAITLLGPEQLSALAAERAKQVAARPKPPPPPPPQPKVAVAACLELGAFNPGEVARVQQLLEPLALILACRPDVLAKGGDWKPETIVCAAEVRGWGGSVHSIPFRHQRSTTALLKKILR